LKRQLLSHFYYCVFCFNLFIYVDVLETI